MGGTQYQKKLLYLKLFQNFSFWNSFLGFSGKTGLLPVFPRACFIEPKLRSNRVLEQAHLLIFFWVFLFSLSGAWAADIRTTPLNINVILDGSREMRAFTDEAAAWLCDYLVEGVLIEGDQLNIWIAGEKAQRAYSGLLGGGGWKETIKKIFRSFVPEAGQADFAGALGEASRLSGGRGDIPAYTILVCGSSRGLVSLETEGAAYLRYSRNREFAGWRVITAALDAGPRIREAVRAYLGGG
jgi:hypothetical protein